MIDIDDIPGIVVDFYERWSERDERVDLIDRAVRGDWGETEDTAGVTNRSPNMLQVALEDTAEAASKVPSVRVIPSKPTKQAQDHAAEMERMAMSYLKASQLELLQVQELQELVGFGYSALAVVRDPETRAPFIQHRNPRECYPEKTADRFGPIRRCLFLREIYATQLPSMWLELYEERLAQIPDKWQNDKLVLVEYYDEHETVVVGMWGQRGAPHDKITWIPVEFDRWENTTGMCPVVVPQRITLDGEPRGQFDQVVDVMRAHIRLMSMVLDYADQAVYSDVWVKDLVGEMSWGGGSYIQLGPQGQIGRVAPAVTSMTVFQELEQLMNGIHLGGRWPKVRPGEVDQAIASAKFVEATAGVMNTAIRTLHLIMKRALEQALRICFVLDKQGPAKRPVSGILRNQQFLIDRNADHIDLDAEIQVDYGVGLGRDPAQSAVLAIQMKQAGFVSNEFVQENMEGITDVQREQRRIDVEAFREIALARLVEGLQSGEVPMSVLPELAKARMNGDDVFEILDKYVIRAQEEQAASALTSGIDGSQMQPGAPPGLGPGVPPPPPGIAGLLGGAGAPPGPGGPPGAGPGEPPVEGTARLSVPAGGRGSFIGTQSGT